MRLADLELAGEDEAFHRLDDLSFRKSAFGGLPHFCR
jgi:hypothetical protein